MMVTNLMSYTGLVTVPIMVLCTAWIYYISRSMPDTLVFLAAVSIAFLAISFVQQLFRSDI